MDVIKHDKAQKLPMITLENEVIGTSELQKVSGKYLRKLKDEGPKIVAINGVKGAVLVDYEQYLHFQKTFAEIFKNMSVINQLLPQIPEGHELQINELRLRISGSLQQIVKESPESSPFADLMDAIMGVATGIFAEHGEPAPAGLKQNAQKQLNKTAKKVVKKHGRPQRNLTE